MSIRKIKPNEIFINQIEFNPKVEFFVFDGKTYYNNKPEETGKFASNINLIPTGHISLYELNVDRTSGSTGLIYPFITKDGSLTSFRTISTSNFNSDFSYGDIVSSSYPLSATITREFYQLGETRTKLNALKNTLEYYLPQSKHYQYSSSLGNKETQPLNLISVPSIFYGDSIKKGTIKLDFYISGTLIGTLEDKNKNGDLVQTGPSGSTGSGSVAGSVLYTEGFFVITGSWGLETGIARNYLNDVSNLLTSSWICFGAGMSGSEAYTYGSLPSSSFNMYFEGVNKTPILTTLLHARRGEVNNSLNPTFIDFDLRKSIITSSFGFTENKEVSPANVVSSSYADPEPYLEKTTFISSIKLYDENKNVIGIAKLAKPVRKTQDRDLTFKLKLDL